MKKYRNTIAIVSFSILLSFAAGYFLRWPPHTQQAEASSSPETLCTDVMIQKPEEEACPTTRELAGLILEMLAGAPGEKTNAPEQGDTEWIFHIDGVVYEYARYGEPGARSHALFSEKGEWYPLPLSNRTLTLLARYHKGQKYYDASFDGYLLNQAALIPSYSRDGLTASLYLNEAFYLTINDLRMPLNRERDITLFDPIQTADNYWRNFTQLYIIEAKDTGEPLVLCSVGDEVNGYGYLQDWGLYRYCGDQIEQLRYAPGEFEKLKLEVIRRGDEFWWHMPALGVERKIEWTVFSKGEGLDAEIKAYEALVQKGDVRGLGVVEDLAIQVNYSYASEFYNPFYVTIQHPVHSAGHYVSGWVDVSYCVTSKGLVVDTIYDWLPVSNASVR